MAENFTYLIHLFDNSSKSDPTTVLNKKNYPIGIFCISLFKVSIISNSILIWKLSRKSEIKTGNNVLILASAIFNILGTLLGIPLVTISAFDEK